MHQEHLSEGTPVQPPREPAGGVLLPRGSGDSGGGCHPSTEVEGSAANLGRRGSSTSEGPAANPGRTEQMKEQLRVLCRSSMKTGSDIMVP